MSKFEIKIRTVSRNTPTSISKIENNSLLVSRSKLKSWLVISARKLGFSEKQ